MNFKNQPIRNKNCLRWPCLLKDRDEMSNLYRGPSIDASYQLSDNLEKCQSEQELPVAAMFVNGSGQNDQSL
jgi:hypothetical protein